MLAFTGCVLMLTWIFGKTAYNALQSVWRSAHALRENFHVTALATTDERHAATRQTQKSPAFSQAVYHIIFFKAQKQVAP